MNTVTPTQDGATLTIDFESANDLAIGIVRSLGEHDINVGQGSAACMLVLAHLLGPEELSDDEAIAFVELMLNTAGMYFAGEEN